MYTVKQEISRIKELLSKGKIKNAINGLAKIGLKEKAQILNKRLYDLNNKIISDSISFSEKTVEMNKLCNSVVIVLENSEINNNQNEDEIHEVKFNRAIDLKDKSMYHKAFKILSELNKEVPNNKHIMFEIAVIYKSLDMTDESISLLNKIITNYPDFTEAHFLLADSTWTTQLYLAIDSILNACQKAPENNRYVDLLMKIISNQNTDSQKQIVEYIKNNLEDAAILNLLIGRFIHTPAEDHVQAVNCFKKALLSNPDVSIIYYYLADAHNRLGDTEKEMQAIKYAILYEGSSSSYVSKGAIHYRLGAYEEAIRAYSISIEMNGKDAEVFVSRGTCYGMLEETGSAKNDFLKAVEIDNKNNAAYYNLAIVYNILNNSDLALKYLDKAVKIDPQFLYLKFRADIHKSLNDDLNRKINLEWCIKVLNENINQSNGHDLKSCICELLEVSLKIGITNQTEEAIQLGFKMFPNYYRIFAYRAKFNFDLGNYSKAYQDIKIALSIKEIEFEDVVTLNYAKVIFDKKGTLDERSLLADRNLEHAIWRNKVIKNQIIN